MTLPSMSTLNVNFKFSVLSLMSYVGAGTGCSNMTKLSALRNIECGNERVIIITNKYNELLEKWVLFIHV